MTGDISAASTSFSTSERDGENQAQTLKNNEIGEPTTDRRVGRSMKRSPGPSADDGASSATSDEEEAPEEIGSNIIDEIQGELDTEHGRNRFFHALDGRDTANRSDDDHEKLNETLLQLKRERTLFVKIIPTRSGVPVTIRPRKSRPIEVTLTHMQHCVWRTVGYQHWIIAAINAPKNVVMFRILWILAEEIELLALENGVIVSKGGVLRLLHFFAIRFFPDYPLYQETMRSDLPIVS